MNCYLPWNLKDMTNISAEKLQKNMSQQSSYIELYRSELLKESLRFNIASLLRHVCLNRASFGTDDMSKTATDCLVVFLHASVFRKVAYFAPTDAENPAVGKCARNLHRLMLENVKSTMRFIDYEVLLKVARGEIDESSILDERRRIHSQVFPSDEVINVCDRDDINNAFFTLIDLENGKAKGFVDFDVIRSTNLDQQICQRLSAVPRLDDKFPQSRYGIIGSCNSYLDTPFIKYSGSYYSFVTAFSLRRIASVVSELAASIPKPVAEEPVLEEPAVEPEPETEPVISITPEPQTEPEPEDTVIEEQPEPVLEEPEPQAETMIEETVEEPEEEPVPEQSFIEPEAEPEPASEEQPEEESPGEEEFEEEPEEEPALSEPEPVDEEPSSEPESEPEVYAEPEMTEASDDEEDDIPFDEPSEEEPAVEPAPEAQEQPETSEESESMFDEDDEIENNEDDSEGSMPSDDDSAYLETDEYEYPDEFEEDTSDSEAETEPEEDVYEETEFDNDAAFSPASELPYDEELADEPFERQTEEYTALVSPDTYEYLDETNSSEFTSDPMLDEQDADGYYYNDEDEETDEVQEDNEPDPYSGESLFSIVDESDEEDATQEEEKPEFSFVLASHNQEQSFPQDEDEDQQEEPEPEAEPAPEPEAEPEKEPEPEAEAEAPLAEPEPETLPLLDQILKFSPSRNNPIVQYLSSCDMQQKKEIVRFIEMARKAWLIDGKDKMFTIPDSNISVAVFSETQDPMLAIQRRENIGAVMYASQKDSWNSLEISYDASGQFVKADFIRIAKSSFTDWQWKVVEKMGQRLIERRGK
ncbi:MAG: hypothetical protein ILP16_01480 [Spirochaetales bacterium]|nr:hypothetical protein [Spirochaetales bacterium]